MVVSANAPLSASVFFYALPLRRHAGRVVVMPVRAFERLRGADLAHVFPRNAYVNVKMLSAFLSAFAVTAIPLLVNFLIVSMLFPRISPGR